MKRSAPLLLKINGGERNDFILHTLFTKLLKMCYFESKPFKCKNSHTLVQRLTIAEPSWKHLSDMHIPCQGRRLRHAVQREKLISTNQTLKTALVLFPRNIYRQKLFRTLLTSPPFRLIADCRHNWARKLRVRQAVAADSTAGERQPRDMQWTAGCVCRGTTWLRKVVTKSNTKTETSARIHVA
jgi:hypothetical protein